LTKLINVARELKELGNYHLLQAFISGFNNSAVLRLQWTKAKLPKASRQTLEELEVFFLFLTFLLCVFWLIVVHF